MSSGTIKMVSEDMRSSIIRVVHYDNKNFEGTFYNLYYGIEIPFENLTRLLFLMEDLMNELDYPQASMKGKRFGIEEKLSKRDSIQKQHSIAKQDTLATFKIKVLFRQGASWQGKIHWLEENLETTFRSVLELVKLMDSALPSQSCCLIGLDEAEAI